MAEEPIDEITVKTYKPTPFSQASWEVVGSLEICQDFLPLAMEVIKGPSADSDPMFQVFDETAVTLGDTHFHGGELVAEEEDNEQGSLFDPAVIQEQIELAHAEGKQVGYAEGVDATRLEIAKRYEELSQQLNTFNSQLMETFNRFIVEAEQETIKLALAVAKKLLVTTAEAKPEYILEVIRVGLSKLGAAKPLKIRVSPQDLEFLEVIGVPPEMSTEELGVAYIADDTIRSGCRIETDYGDIDLELERMWEQVSADLFEVQK